MLEIIDINKSYQGESLLHNISFSVGDNEIVCLLGASGSGKSTLLRIISGLEAPDSGQVKWNDEDLEKVPVYRRNFGLMFQDYALFPFLDVSKNVAFGLKMQQLSSDAIKLRVDEVLKLVDLGGFEHRQVTDLSGGEQQRVALARVLAPRPRLLMFDEPLGALDRRLRENLLIELRHILRQNQVPVIYVTHDQEEAFALADRILLLHEGRIVRSGSPAEVWKQPGSAWSASFLGLGNIFPGKVLFDGGVQTTHGILRSVDCLHSHQAGDEISVLIRSEIDLETHGENWVEGVVIDTSFTKSGFQVRMENDLVFFMNEAPMVGKKLRISLPANAIQCLG